MRVLGWVLALALALTASIGSRPGRWVRATIQCPTVGMATDVEHPAPRVNRTADLFRRVGARIVLLVGGVPMRGRGSPLTGSGVPAAAPSIIRSQIGAARRAVGVIRSQPAFSPSGSGFTPPNESSYRGVKLFGVSAALGAILPAVRCGFAAGGAAFRRSPAGDQTRLDRSRQSSTGVSAPYRAAISAGSGSS
jgi:hypothetical protein